MTDELKKLITSGESGTMEFKESFGKAAIEAMAAFANGEGGFLFIGVGDQGECTGVDASEEVIKDWLNQLKMATEPSLFPNYTVFDCEGRGVVLFTVQEYPLKPVACKGRYYKRVSASNHSMTSDEIVELKLQSMNASFDSFSVAGGIDSLDPIALEKFDAAVRVSGRFSPSGDIVKDLEKLGFFCEGRLTRAAELLFGNHHTSIHIGRFKSRHTIIDDLVVRAPLILAVDEAMEFMKKNMRLGYDFTGELKRKEMWQYPLPVLRELLLNAVIHKDYRDPTDVIIKMFDEHVEFVNPGDLFGALKLEALQTDFYRASHRNKLLAEGFYLSGEVEKYGTGFVRIRERLKEDAPDLKLSFREEAGAFRVSLEGEVALGRGSRSVTEGLNEGLISLLEAVQKDPGCKAKELGPMLDRPIKTLERQIRTLIDKELIERRGSRKTGGYYALRRDR